MANAHVKTIRSIKRHRTAMLARLVTRAYYLHRRGRDEEMYNIICEEFVTLGGVYVKFLQGVLLRSSVMRKWHNPEKLKIFENLDSEPLNIIEILQRELPPQKLAQIKQIQPQPFAAGSFGQVYYGLHRNGTPIIVKVLRPMIRELLQYDLRLLSTFSKSFFVKLYKNMNLELRDALKEFSESTMRETDYLHEASFAAELYQAYRGRDDFVIPLTFTELCTANIIVQEYIEGLSVAKLVKLKEEQGVDPVAYVKDILGTDLDAQLELIGYELLMGVFKLPRIQGDPHPGNIRLMPNNHVGLIDFGISAQAPEEKAAFFGIIEAYDRIFKGSQSMLGLFEQGLRFFVSDLYKSLKRLGSFVGQQKNKNYVNEVGKVAEAAFEQVTGSRMVEADFKNDQNILTIINKIVNRGNRFGLVMKLEATEILRAIQTYTAVVSSLGRYEQVIPVIMARVVADVRRDYPEIADDNEEHVSIGDALETVTNWLERVADRDPALFQQLSEKIRGPQKAKPDKSTITKVGE